MRTTSIATLTLAALMGLSTAPARAADAAATPGADQVVVPQVDRRDIAVPHFPSNDFEIGTFIGSYAAQNFGTSLVGGLKLGYHINEDFFVEGAYGQTHVSDAQYRQVLPGGIFPTTRQKLDYYNISFGVNVLPGEVFIGRRYARPTVFYLIGGIGSTQFDAQRHSTFNLGAGWRVFLTDRVALQVDLRDHLYSLDLLGKRQSTQNLEWTAGVSAFF